MQYVTFVRKLSFTSSSISLSFSFPPSLSLSLSLFLLSSADVPLIKFLRCRIWKAKHCQGKVHAAFIHFHLMKFPGRSPSLRRDVNWFPIEIEKEREREIVRDRERESKEINIKKKTKFFPEIYIRFGWCQMRVSSETTERDFVG